MNTIPDSGELQELAEKLCLNDVYQAVWEHEGRGYIFKAKQVLQKMKESATEDFRDRKTVMKIVAPDALKYSFWLSRWIGQQVAEIKDAGEDNIAEADRTRIWEPYPEDTHKRLYLSAMQVLSVNLINLENGRGEAITSIPAVARQASGLLLLTTVLQAQDYSFDLVDSFNNRLVDLSQRFGITEPVA